MMNPEIVIPDRMLALPRDERGYPIPWFVAEVGGKFDFRVMDREKRVRAARLRLCWVCGGNLGRFAIYVVGPMCIVNRTSSEPPCHGDCATFSARACPFLSLPNAKRREHDLPSNKVVAGNMITRNPGVTVLWGTRRDNELFSDGKGEFLFHLPDPSVVSYWREGRLATRAEVLESIDSGLPALKAIAAKEGERAMFELGKQVGEALKLVPA